MRECDRCRQFTFGDVTCKCQSVQYRLEEDNDPDYWTDGFCRNIEEFAEEVAEEYWQQDPCDPNNFEVTVIIRDWNQKETRFVVTAEASVSFSANPEPK